MTHRGQHLLDGERRTAGRAGWFEQAEPRARARVVALFPCGGVAELLAAANAARACASSLAHAPPSVLDAGRRAFASELRARRAELEEALFLSLGIGEEEAAEEVRVGLAAFERALASPLPPELRGPLLLEPAPDLPFAPLARALGRALRCGTPVVLQGGEVAPWVADRLADCAVASGLRPGALQLVHGRAEAFRGALREAPWLRAWSWSHWSDPARAGAGSATGEAGPESRPSCVAVADPDSSASELVEAWLPELLRRGGALYEAPRALAVHEDLYSEVVDEVVDRLRACAPEGEEGERLAPLPELRLVKECERFVREALEEGAALPCGGQIDNRGGRRQGTWFEPTLIVNLPREGACWSARVRGPIALVARWRDEADLEDLCRAGEFARRLRYRGGVFSELWGELDPEFRAALPWHSPPLGAPSSPIPVAD